MLKKIYASLCLGSLLLFASTVPAQNRRRTPRRPPPAPKRELIEKLWSNFSSAEGGFSVLLPDEPVKEQKILSSDMGEIPYVSFTATTGIGEYMAAYSDYPFSMKEQETSKLVFQGAQDKVIASRSLKLISQRSLTVDGYPAQQFTASGDGFIINNRMVAVDQRFYQVVAVTTDYRKLSPDLIRFYEKTLNDFLDSFKIIGGSALAVKSDSYTTPAPAKIDIGRFENSTYINSYFGFRLSLPSEWRVHDRATNQMITEVGREMAKGSNKELNAALDESAEVTVTLFTSSKPAGSDTNVVSAIIQCGAERMSDPRVTGRLYAQGGRNILLATTLGYKLDRDIYEENIGGVKFSVFEIERSYTGSIFKQQYFSAVRKGYALFFIITYRTDEDLAGLKKILRSVKFE
jgi:hypothetical protein